MSYALHVLGSLEGPSRSLRRRHRRLHESLDLAVEGDARSASARRGTTSSRRTCSPAAPPRRSISPSVAPPTSNASACIAPMPPSLHRPAKVALLALGRWPRPTPSEPACSPATSTPTSPSRSSSAASTCSSARRSPAEALLADLASASVRTTTRRGVRRGSRAGDLAGRLAAGGGDGTSRADETTATTDEVILELRLTALAMRLEADEYDWAGTSASPRDVD